MILLTGHYQDEEAARNREFLECLHRNAENAHISRVFAFIEERASPSDVLARTPTLAHQKIELVPHGRRVRFADLFAYAARVHAGGVVAIANSDIFFDETLALLHGCDLHGCLLALSRWDEHEHGRPVHFDHGDSQDAWIFRPPIPTLAVDFYLGIPGCDNRLAYEASRAGLRLLNPSRTLRARHLHASGVRRYRAEDRLQGRVLRVPCTTLAEAGLSAQAAHRSGRAALAQARFERASNVLHELAGDEISEATLFEVRSAIERATARAPLTYAELPSDGRMLALTSLSPEPHQRELQRTALRSWREAGLEPVSFNHPSELSVLQDYEGVRFIPVEQTAHTEFGRHYVPISCMTDFLSGYDGYALIVNSDIVLRCEPWKLKRAAYRSDAGLCYLVRHNHDGDPAHARPERYGIDGFLFHGRHAGLFAPSFLCMGKPFWDYWLPHTFSASGLPVYTLEEPVAFHQQHAQRWSDVDWHRCALEFDRLAGVLGSDRSHSACAAMSQHVRRSFDQRRELIGTRQVPIRDWVERRFREPSAKLFLELGAHQGTDTAWLAEIPNVALHAFEPDPRNRVPQRANVKVTRAAVSDRDGRAPFIQSLHGWSQEWTHSSSLKRPKLHLTRYPVTFGDAIEVDTVTLDRYAREHALGTVDFIWADIQGAEAEMIRGATELLRRTRYLYTEYSDEQLYEGQAGLRELLQMLPGYRVVELYPEDVLLENSNFVG